MLLRTCGTWKGPGGRTVHPEEVRVKEARTRQEKRSKPAAFKPKAAALGVGKIFNTEGTEVGAQSALRRRPKSA